MGTINIVNITSSLKELRFRMKDNKVIQPFNDVLDDAYITGFLIGKKGDVDKALDCLEYLINMRTLKYKFITKAYRPSSAPLLDNGMLYTLNHKDPHGRVVVVCRVIKWIPSQHTFEKMLANSLFFMDEGIRCSVILGSDVTFIYDCDGLSFEHVKQLSPRNLRMLLDMFIKSMPSRPKGMHFVNQGVLLGNIFRIVKPLLDKKIRDRFYMHSSNFESLHEFIPASILPQSLGGDLTDEQAYDAASLARIRGNDEFYINLGVNS